MQDNADMADITVRLDGINAVDVISPEWWLLLLHAANPSIAVGLEMIGMFIPDQVTSDGTLRLDPRLARLAGVLARRRATLLALVIRDCQIGPNSLGLFLAQSLVDPQSKLTKLAFLRTPLPIEGFAWIQKVLERVRLTEIEIIRCDDFTEGCRLICDAAASNPHIRRVTVVGDFYVYEDTLARVLGPGSAITHLVVEGDTWTKLNARQEALLTIQARPPAHLQRQLRGLESHQERREREEEEIRQRQRNALSWRRRQGTGMRTLVERMETNRVLEDLTIRSTHLDFSGSDIAQLADVIEASNPTLRRIVVEDFRSSPDYADIRNQARLRAFVGLAAGAAPAPIAMFRSQLALQNLQDRLNHLMQRNAAIGTYSPRMAQEHVVALVPRVLSVPVVHGCPRTVYRIIREHVDRVRLDELTAKCLVIREFADLVPELRDELH
jgi:hypothetical protein